MKSRRLRILSYNIHKGFTARNRTFVLREIRAALRDVHPDVVFLQEVLGEHQGYRSRIKSWPMESQFEYLADTLWPHYAYGRNAVYTEGHHGNAILSKFPIRSWRNEDVSCSRFERRGLLHAVIKPYDDRPDLHLVCAHFGLLERDRKEQAVKLCDLLRGSIELGQGLVVAGDFNDWGLKLSPIFKHHAGLDEAFQRHHGHHARTFPSRLPLFRLDRIYYLGLEPQSARTLQREPWSQLSDHVPLIADFEWE